MKQYEYIEYLKTINNKNISTALKDFIDQKITFNQLEKIALDNGQFSKHTFIKSLKIKRLLDMKTERKLKKTHKQLMIFEAGFIYCKRHNINKDLDTFIEEDFMSENFNADEGEFNDIMDDLRMFRYYDGYKLKEITVEEYDMTVDEFGSN